MTTTSHSIPWREAFPEHKEEDLPTVSLRWARRREGLTPKKGGRTLRHPVSPYLSHGTRQDGYRDHQGDEHRLQGVLVMSEDADELLDVDDTSLLTTA